MVRFGETSLRDPTYDYRKIYKGFLKVGGKSGLSEYINNVKRGTDKGTKDIKNLVNSFNSIVDSVRYAFNTDPQFKESILKNRSYSFILMSIFLLSGNLDKAQKFVDMYKSLYNKMPRESSSDLKKAVVSSYFVTHNYDIINFLLDNYSIDFLRGIIDNLGSTYLKYASDADIRRLLMDQGLIKEPGISCCYLL
jgi:hypothetical protein